MRKQALVKDKPSHSLSRSLLLWFLLLALVPLTINVLLGYRQAADSLTTIAMQGLERNAQEKVRFIQNWFDYRLMDLHSQAKNQRNAELLVVLREGLQTSGLGLAKFIKSNTWARLVDKRQEDLARFMHQYDYIYDLFLIDVDGNILFTVARESDLGSNIFDGAYANTRFARSARASMETGQTQFSDLEHYIHSNNQVTGFLTTPIFDEQGNKIGLFAIQIKIKRINKLMSRQDSDSSLTHYLVGDDGLLRTPLDRADTGKAGETSVLTQRVHIEQPNSTQLQQGKSEANEDSTTAAIYRNYADQQVIGINHTIKLPGTNWLLVSEIAQNEALATAHNLGWLMITIALLTVALVTGLAIFQSRRITQPIHQLIEISEAVAAGKRNQQAVINSFHEIDILAKAFNHMLAMRHTHEIALEESHQETKKALAEVVNLKYALDQHAIVAITDMQGTITFTNNKFSEISGYTQEELLGQNHRLLNSGHHDTTFFREMFRTIAAGKAWHGEICNKAKGGHLYWVDTTIVPFMGDKGKPVSYIAIRADITERKKIEHDLLQAKEAAEAATRQKSDFLANMSHEIRTPMNGIIGMTGLLLDTQLDPKQLNYVKTTMTSADALLTIINDILDLSKIEAGKMELEAVPFNLQKLTEDIVELMVLKCHEKDLEMLLRFKPGTQQFVIGDPGRVRQVLLNLLSNSIKFTDQGHILLTVESTEVNDNTALFTISIQDTGIGISEDKLARIFNKFDQEDNSTTRKYGGTGLGLAICQQFCNLMHGDITVESEKDQGSTFIMTIQLDINKEPAYEHRTGNQVILQGLKVLIVDDSEISRTILTEQLATLQMRLVSTVSSKEAIKLMQKAIAEDDPFDIVITDDRMPDMNGESLVTEISRLNLLTNGALVFITSSPHRGQASHLKEMGIDGYLTKPIYPSEITQMLSLIWDAKRQGKDIPLVTRHSFQEVKTSTRKKPTFINTQILLTDDNNINIMVATEFLEGYGCTVIPAENGQNALTLIKEREFDLIFMDCQMPEMDGFEATEEIRKLENEQLIKKMPVIAFTANAMKSDEERCIRAGMDDFITKPINQERLEGVLTKWLPHKLKTVTDHENTENTALIQKNLAQAEQTEICSICSETLDLNVFNKLKKLFGAKFSYAIEQNTLNTLKNVDLAESAIQQGDLETLERAAHSIKGTSAQFGAIKLNSIALELENLAINSALNEARILFKDLRDAQETVASMMLLQISTDGENDKKASSVVKH